MVVDVPLSVTDSKLGIESSQLYLQRRNFPALSRDSRGTRRVQGVGSVGSVDGVFPYR